MKRWNILSEKSFIRRLINIVGPLLTEFPVDRMAFGQSWPKTFSSNWPKAWSTEKIRSIVKHISGWPKADWPNGGLGYWPKKVPKKVPKTIKQLWASGQTNVSQRNQRNTFFGQSEISTADWPKNHTILTIQNVHFSHFYTLLQQHIGNIFYAISNLSFKLVFLNLSF